MTQKLNPFKINWQIPIHRRMRLRTYRYGVGDFIREKHVNLDYLARAFQDFEYNKEGDLIDWKWAF